MLSEHFAAEEQLMSTGGWSRLEHLIVRYGLTYELSTLAMKHLPEMLRFHEMASDFGFGKFALGVAEDPGRRFARRIAGG
jgi:hypothetical protein